MIGIKLKLGNIYAARESWSKFASLRMPPHTAYKLFKYAKHLTAENEAIEMMRVKLILQTANAKPGDNVTLKMDSPEYNAFVGEFNKVLETESELRPFPMSLSRLLDLVGKEQGNLLSIQDLAVLEPFFEENKEESPQDKTAIPFARL